MIYITGDTHGIGDIHTILDAASRRLFKKEDYLIIAGDFGALWNANEPDDEEIRLLQTYNSLPCMVLFIDGNHENHDRLDHLPTGMEFGSDVGIVTPYVFHLRRGRIYEIEGKIIFTFGGGYSLDKLQRVQGISWWPQELPTYSEYKEGLLNLENHGNKVDYVISHTCPMSTFQAISGKYGFSMAHKNNEEERSLRNYLDHIKVNVEWKQWFFGHFHLDENFDNIHAVYNDILTIDGDVAFSHKE